MAAFSLMHNFIILLLIGAVRCTFYDWEGTLPNNAAGNSRCYNEFHVILNHELRMKILYCFSETFQFLCENITEHTSEQI